MAMNAAIVESFAKGPRYGSFADPVAEAGEVLVQVEAAGLHPIVKALANGTHYGSTGKLPFLPGVEGGGRLGEGRGVNGRRGSSASRGRRSVRLGSAR